MPAPNLATDFRSALCTGIVSSVLFTAAAVEIVTEKKANPMQLLMGTIFAALACSSYKSGMKQIRELPPAATAVTSAPPSPPAT